MERRLKMKKITLFLIFSLLLFISSCTSAEKKTGEETLKEEATEIYQKSQCGNNNCEFDEDSSTCCLDCGCPEKYYCNNNACQKLAECGNGIIEEGETASNCCTDTGCITGETCENNMCVELKPQLDITFNQYGAESVTILMGKNGKIELGEIIIKNLGNDDAKNVQLEIFSSQGYFEIKTYDIGTVGKGDYASEHVTLTFDDSALELADKTNIGLIIKIIYQNSINREYSSETSVDFYVFGRNSITEGWPDSYAAWVTPHQNIIREFAAKATAGLAASSSYSYPNQFRQDLAAQWLFESMRAYGVKYVNDIDTVGDYVQLPYEVLKRKTGDCEDNAILYASLLEAVGIDSVIIIIPSHAFAGYINYTGDLVPVETTAETFSDALEIGKSEIEEYANDIKIVYLSEARSEYDEALVTDEPEIDLPAITKEVSECSTGWSWGQLLVAKADVKLYNSGTAPGAGCAAVWTMENNKLKDKEIQCWTLNPSESLETTLESNVNIFEGFDCYAY